MRLAVDKLSALRALRVYRSSGGTLPAERCELPTPDPSPQKRWSARVVPFERLAVDGPDAPGCPISVVVPTPAARLRASFFSCTMRSTSVPKASFASLGDGLFVPCPELLFYELATIMEPEALALVGYELCGTFSRDARDPRCGEVTYDVAPVTSVEKIAAYLGALGDRPGALIARRVLGRVADNAWSPMEAIIALLATLPVHELGYELGRVELNVRHGATPELVALGVKGSRVPDVEVVGTRVGFNYDSALHLDLESIAQATLEGDPAADIARVREKYIDDLRRNRELAAQGRIILPVTAQDLFAPGALDAVMLEAAMTIAELGERQPLRNVQVALVSHAERRQWLVWSLLPWPEGARYARKLYGSRSWLCPA